MVCFISSHCSSLSKEASLKKYGSASTASLNISNPVAAGTWILFIPRPQLQKRNSKKPLLKYNIKAD
jgi:hypothetical protein